MAIRWALVTLLAITITNRSKANFDWYVSITDQILNIGLKLLAQVTAGRDVTVLADKFFVTRIHRAGRMQPGIIWQQYHNGNDARNYTGEQISPILALSGSAANKQETPKQKMNINSLFSITPWQPVLFIVAAYLNNLIHFPLSGSLYYDH